MKKLLLAIVCFAVALPAFAASPWDGTWKLDPAKSHLTGDSFTYTKLPDGKWQFAAGVLKVDVAPNGKPYPVLDADHTVTLTLINDHTLAMAGQFKGKTTSTSRDVLSADGKTLSSTTTGTNPDGSSFTTSDTAVRSGSGSGFFGTWVSTKTKSSTNDIVDISTAPDGVITMRYPISKDSVSFKSDDKPVPISGPQTISGLTVAYKAPSSHRLDYAVFLNGKKISEGYQLLAADGKSYDDTSWAPGKMNEKTTSVYIKQ
ncbi:MAG: hypothetical protein WBY53_18595 [Acidobacteriaceae bacterium]